MTKHLWTDVGEGETRVRVREMADEHAEARFVTAEVNRLRRRGRQPVRGIAIFYRTNAQSRVLEDMMVRAGIGYQIIGGTKFYERAGDPRTRSTYLTFLVKRAKDGTAFTAGSRTRPRPRAPARRRCRRVLGACGGDGHPASGRPAISDYPRPRDRRAAGRSSAS